MRTALILAMPLLLTTALHSHASQSAAGPPAPMAADANPAFTVATVKPSDPRNTNWSLGTRGTHFFTSNTNVDDLISFAYGIHAKQVVGGPAWFSTDKYDVEGVPDTEGKPNRQQLTSMVQGLLADRFKLVVHRDKKELAVYALTVGKNGPRLTKSTAAPEGPSGYGFGPLGTMTVKSMTIAAFAGAMQRTVLDKPLVDQTGLVDKYDFILKWTPDDSQFSQIRGTGISVPTGAGDPNAPPGLYTAIQEQLGLKLEPVRALTDVLVVDHAEKPSAN
ncbi:MAG: TIGR03435 family protein [Terracidiphilus sp.]